MTTRTLKLISEAKSFDLHPVDFLTESKQENGSTTNSYFIEGIFVQCEAKNRNGRNYRKNLMVPCVQKYIQERMNPNGYRSYGELGHPNGVEINLDRVSHYIKELNWNGNNVIGKAEILTENPCGRIVETFLKKKLVLGVSTRGLGSLSETANQDGSKDVTSYEMIAEDIVADPSAPQGFVEGILENKQYIIKDNGLIFECVENLEKEVSILPKKSNLRNTVFLLSLEKFLDGLKNN